MKPLPEPPQPVVSPDTPQQLLAQCAALGIRISLTSLSGIRIESSQALPPHLINKISTQQQALRAWLKACTSEYGAPN